VKLVIYKDHTRIHGQQNLKHKKYRKKNTSLPHSVTVKCSDLRKDIQIDTTTVNTCRDEKNYTAVLLNLYYCSYSV